jgi:WD40 repeat protein
VDCLEYSSFPAGGDTAAALISDNQSLVVSCSCDNTIRVWAISGIDSIQLKVDFLFKIFDYSATWWLCLALVVSETYGPVVISGGKDHTLRIWKLQKPLDADGNYSSALVSTPVRVINGHNSRVLNVGVFDEAGQLYIVTSCKDYVIRIWDFNTAELVRTLEGHTSTINSLSVFTSSNPDYDKKVTMITSGCEKG